MARRQKNEPAKDRFGRYRRDIGYKVDAKGGHVQHRFGLGMDKHDAILRGLHLERCWDAVERRWVRDRREGQAVVDRPLWDDTTLAIAQAVARGEAVVYLPMPGEAAVARIYPSLWEDLAEGFGQPAGSVEALFLRNLRLDFSGVPIRIELADEERQQRADAAETRRVESARRVVEEVVPQTGQTLHAALDAYVRWLPTEHVVPGSQPPRPTQHCLNLINLANRTKAHQADMALDQLGQPQLEAMIRYWANRPHGAKKRPISVETAKDHVRVIKLFVEWLHKSTVYRWRKPADWRDNMRVRIKPTSEEISAMATTQQVDTYTVEELATLYKHATRWERALLLLGLNCAFGPGEVEGLLVAEVHLDKAHGYYDVTGSWIKRMRGKTVVYAEWQLWPETVEAIRWLMERRSETKAKCPNLVVKRTGLPIAELTASNNRSREIANAWTRLTDRVRETAPDFRKLSFGKVRKTSGNMVKQVAGSEMAYLHISHGNPFKTDILLDLYTNKDFRKLFGIQAKVREQLAPMFDQR